MVLVNMEYNPADPKVYQEIKEGLARLVVAQYEGVPSANMPVFYNSEMSFRRDVSCAVLRCISKESAMNRKGRRHIDILDGLSATGVSGIRYSLETPSENMAITLNDHNPLAYSLIQKNIAINNAQNTFAVRRDLNAVLSENFYDVIDLDPFGTPVPYLDAAFQSLKLNGYLFVTATDTGVLCGTFPNTCWRRYMSRTQKTPFMQETGLRTLIGYCARTAAKYDISIKPLLSYYANHYYRIHLATSRGSGKADDALKKLGFILYNPETAERLITNKPPEGGERDRIVCLGPLWLERIHDDELLMKLTFEPGTVNTDKCRKYRELWYSENKMLPYYYTQKEIGSMFKVGQPKIAKIIERLRNAGYLASRTHFASDAFKTNAPPKQIIEILT